MMSNDLRLHVGELFQSWPVAIDLLLYGSCQCSFDCVGLLSPVTEGRWRYVC